MSKRPSAWDKIPQHVIDETLAAMAAEDPRNFRPYSEFRAEIQAKIAEREGKSKI